MENLKMVGAKQREKKGTKKPGKERKQVREKNEKYETKKRCNGIHFGFDK